MLKGKSTEAGERNEIMIKRTRSKKEKALIAIEAIKEGRTLSEL
jgi:hypothetical protein